MSKFFPSKQKVWQILGLAFTLPFAALNLSLWVNPQTPWYRGIVGVSVIFSIIIARQVGRWAERRVQARLRMQEAHLVDDVHELLERISSGRSATADMAKAMRLLAAAEERLYPTEFRPRRTNLARVWENVRAAAQRQRRVYERDEDVRGPEILEPDLWRVEISQPDGMSRSILFHLDDICLPDGRLTSEIEEEKKPR